MLTFSCCSVSCSSQPVHTSRELTCPDVFEENKLQIGKVFLCCFLECCCRSSGWHLPGGATTTRFQYLKGGWKKNWRDFWQGAVVGRTNGAGTDREQGRLDIGSKFFSLRMVQHWKRLPREAADDPSLEVLKARLDGVVEGVSPHS